MSLTGAKPTQITPESHFLVIPGVFLYLFAPGVCRESVLEPAVFHRRRAAGSCHRAWRSCAELPPHRPGQSGGVAEERVVREEKAATGDAGRVRARVRRG